MLSSPHRKPEASTSSIRRSAALPTGVADVRDLPDEEFLALWDAILIDDAIKNQLLARRHQLLGRYHDELARANEELESVEIETVDKASEQWDVRVLSILGDADAAALGRIVAALRRLDLGIYGTCTDCATSIPPVSPWS